jgi:hypothetical protein
MMGTVKISIDLRTAPMSQSVLAPQIADILHDSLRAVFARLCTQRYGAPISLRRVKASAPPSSTARFQIDRAGHLTLEAEFIVRHLGGNMYEIAGTIEEGPSRAFTYCLPDPMPLLAPKAPRLAQDVAAFLLDALERRLGSDLLRTELRPPSTTPERSGSSASAAA